FHAVVSSGPPHSAHLAGMIATWDRPQLHHIDLRDPWAKVLDNDWIERSWIQETLVPKFERLAIRRSRRVIGNTAFFAEDLRHEYPDAAVSFVPNGVDPERLPAQRELPA